MDGNQQDAALAYLEIMSLPCERCVVTRVTVTCFRSSEYQQLLTK